MTMDCPLLRSNGGFYREFEGEGTGVAKWNLNVYFSIANQQHAI